MQNCAFTLQSKIFSLLHNVAIPYTLTPSSRLAELEPHRNRFEPHFFGWVVGGGGKMSVVKPALSPAAPLSATGGGRGPRWVSSSPGPYRHPRSPMASEARTEKAKTRRDGSPVLPVVRAPDGIHGNHAIKSSTGAPSPCLPKASPRGTS